MQLIYTAETAYAPQGIQASIVREWITIRFLDQYPDPKNKQSNSKPHSIECINIINTSILAQSHLRLKAKAKALNSR